MKALRIGLGSSTLVLLDSKDSLAATETEPPRLSTARASTIVLKSAHAAAKPQDFTLQGAEIFITFFVDLAVHVKAEIVEAGVRS